MSRYVEVGFILRTITTFGVILLAACSVAYAILQGILGVQLGASFSEAFYTLRTLHQGMGIMVWFAVILYGVLAASLILVAAMFATHKVAGPLFRLEMMIDEAMRGKIPLQVRFRQEDQVKPLAEAQGRMFRAVAEREGEVASLLREAGERRASLAEKAHSSPQDWARETRALGDVLQRLARVAAPRPGTG